MTTPILVKISSEAPKLQVAVAPSVKTITSKILIGSRGENGTNASVTSANIVAALGYTPSEQITSVSQLPNDAGYISDAPDDGTQYARKNGSWLAVQSGSTAYADLTGKPTLGTASTHAESYFQLAGSYATLVGGTVPSSQLPSYVDDVLEFATLSEFPATGEGGKIYTATATSKIYRWSGSTYIEISPSPGSTDSVTEGSYNLYFTNARAVSALSTNASGARTNLGLGTASTQNSTAFDAAGAASDALSTATTRSIAFSIAL